MIRYNGTKRSFIEKFVSRGNKNKRGERGIAIGVAFFLGGSMSTVRFLSIVGILLAFTGCSNGGGGNSSPTTSNNGSGGVSPATFIVGGTIIGLSGTVTLQNNGGDDHHESNNRDFSFDTPIASGAAYQVTIVSQPSGQTCSVTNGAGTINGAPVTNILIACAPNPPTLSVSFALKKLSFSWSTAPGATFYQLFERPNAGSAYRQVGGDIAATRYDYDIAVHKINWAEARFVLRACNDSGCTADSAEVDIAAGVLQTIGYVKANARTVQDVFGAAVALSADGSTLAIGAPAEDGGGVGVGGATVVDCGDPEGAGPCRNAGAVYVFARTNGSWQPQAYIKAPQTVARDHFGTAVALSYDGGVLAIGAPGHDGPSGATVSLSGAVYVYKRTGGVWEWDPSGYLRPTHPKTYDNPKGFGATLAIDGNGSRIAVGVPLDSSASPNNPVDDCGTVAPVNCANSAGAVYVFASNASGWSSTPTYVKRLVPGDFDRFGYSVAFNRNGSVLAVGAVGQWNNVNALSGAVHVFDTLTWNAYMLTAAAGDANHFDQFGASVAVSDDGNTIAIGADAEDSGSAADAMDNTSVDSGAVYVFARAGSSWDQRAYLKASNIGAGDRFGTAVSLSGDGNTLAVGAPFEGSAAVMGAGGETDSSVTKAGAAYVFARANGAWAQVSYVKAPNTEPVAGLDELPSGQTTTADQFGASLALNSDGQTLVVGARYEDGIATNVSTNPNLSDNGAVNAGAVYLY